MFLNVIEKCWIITLHIYLSVCVCIFKQQHVLRGEEDDQEEEEGGGVQNETRNTLLKS
jgi:hypothetical protein